MGPYWTPGKTLYTETSSVRGLLSLHVQTET